MVTPPSLSRAPLTDVVRREIGISKAASAAAVEQVLDAIRETLWSGEDVSIRDFGKFKVRNKGKHLGRNPKTGVEVVIPPRRVVTFEPCQGLRDRTAGN